MLKFTDENFQAEVLQSTQPVVIDFWAEWCGPCRMIAPVYERIAEQFKDKAKFGKANVDETGLGAEFDVRGIPTFAIVKDGNIVDVLVGAQSEGKIKQWLEKTLG